MTTGMNENSGAVAVSDADIVRRVLADPEQFAEIMVRYEDKMTRYIRRLGISSPEDRQDVLQNIFIKVYKNLNDFDTDLSFSSWLYRIAHNEAVSWYRKVSVRPEGHQVEDGNTLLQWQPANDTSVERLFDADIDSGRLKQSLAKLAPKFRDPIILRYFEYKEYEEISDILKIPIGSVGTLIHRGKKKLEELLTIDLKPNI